MLTEFSPRSFTSRATIFSANMRKSVQPTTTSDLMPISSNPIESSNEWKSTIQPMIKPSKEWPPWRLSFLHWKLALKTGFSPNRKYYLRKELPRNTQRDTIKAFKRTNISC